MIPNKLKNILFSELKRQQDSLELVASENYVSKNVLDAISNVFTNKYSEGYPGFRYYGGQEFVDELEIYTQNLALEIFGLDEANRGVNVQPLSGSVANLAVYIGLLKPGAKILAMGLSAGGHLTHGHLLNASGKLFEIIPYGVDDDGFIDYDSIHKLAFEHKPDLILAGFSAYSRNIDREFFANMRKELYLNEGHFSYLMADISHIAGLIAGKECGDPFLSFDIVTTTTHKTLRGPRGALIYYSKMFYKRITLRGLIYQAGIKNTDFAAFVEHYYGIKDYGSFIDGRNGRTKEFVLGFVNDNKKLKEYINLIFDKNINIYISGLEKAINRGVFPGVQGGPFDHIMYAKAVAFEEILDPETHWSEYITNIIKNSQAIANGLKQKGRNVSTGGTDNHIILIDVTSNNGNNTGFAGKQAEKALEDIGLSTNKNSIPNDKRKPLDPSGIRLGTPAITSRGFGIEDCQELTIIIDTCLSNINSDGTLDSNIKDILSAKVLELCKKYPLRY